MVGHCMYGACKWQLRFTLPSRVVQEKENEAKESLIRRVQAFVEEEVEGISRKLAREDKGEMDMLYEKSRVEAGLTRCGVGLIQYFNCLCLVSVWVMLQRDNGRGMGVNGGM